MPWVPKAEVERVSDWAYDLFDGLRSLVKRHGLANLLPQSWLARIPPYSPQEALAGLDSLFAWFKSVEQDRAGLQKHVQSLSQENVSLQAQLQTMGAELKAAAGKVSRSEQAVADANVEAQALAKTANAAEEKARVIGTKMKTLEQSLQDLRGQLAKANDRLREQDAVIQKSEERAKTLAKEVAEQAVEIQRLSSVNQDLAKKVEMLQALSRVKHELDLRKAMEFPEQKYSYAELGQFMSAKKSKTSKLIDDLLERGWIEQVGTTTYRKVPGMPPPCPFCSSPLSSGSRPAGVE